MLRFCVIIFATVAGLVIAPNRSAAQTLSELLPGLYEDVIVPQYSAFVLVTGIEPQAKGFENAFHITRLMAHQLSSFPLVSPSAGIAVIEDPTAVTGFSRASGSLGPVYAERALTIGRKRLNFGANYQRITFDHLDGRSLTDGDIVSYTGAPNVVGNIGIFFADELDLTVTTETTTAFATYGVTDRFDVG